MQITTRQRGDVTVLDLEGRMAGGLGGEGLSEAVLRRLIGEADDAPAGEQQRLLLNLAGCTGADSLGIGELISLHVGLSNRGAVLKLVHLPERIRDLLKATQLISMFEIFDDEEEALGSFG